MVVKTEFHLFVAFKHCRELTFEQRANVCVKLGKDAVVAFGAHISERWLALKYVLKSRDPEHRPRASRAVCNLPVKCGWPEMFAGHSTSVTAEGAASLPRLVRHGLFAFKTHALFSPKYTRSRCACSP